MHNKLYKNILKNLPYGYSCHKVIVIDNDTYDFEFVEVNKAFEEYTGICHDKIVGEKISSIKPLIYGQTFNWKDEFNKVVKGKALDTEIFVEKNNQYYKIMISLEDEYIITNIMLQNKGNCPFTEQQCFIRMNIVPVLMLDKLGKLYRINKCWKDNFGFIYKDKEKFFVDFIHPDDCERVVNELVNVTGINIVKIECRIICDSNEYKITELQASRRGKYLYLVARDLTNEKDLEKKLKLSKENFEAFFTAIDDLAFVGDYDGNVLYANKAVQKKLGYTNDEIMNMNLLDFHPEEVREEAMEILDDMFNNRRSTCPLPVIKKDGTYVPVETRAWFGHWNNKDCIFTLSKDLSYEQESLQRLLKVFKEFPAYVTIREMPSKKFIDANKNFIRDFGYTEEELLEKSPLELGIISQKDYLSNKEEILINGSLNEKLMNLRTKSGSIIKGKVSGTFIESQGRKYFLNIIIDVTKHIEYENRLIEKGKLQQLLVKLSSKFINHPLENIDEDINNSLEELGKFVEANRVYIFDYDLTKGTTSNVFEWCNEGISPEIDNLQGIPIEFVPDWYELHRNGETLYIPDVFALDGGVSEVKNILMEQDVKSLITIPMMEGDKCVGFVGFDSVSHHKQYSQDEIELLFIYAQIIVNILMRKKQETLLYESRLKAQQASEVKSNFIARLSHEIRTPLNGALGFLELLYESATMTKQINYVNKAKTSLNILLKLIDDIRDISKIEANKFDIKNGLVDIREIISEVVTPFMFDLDKKEIKINANIAADIPARLAGDADRIKQVITNLLSNSIKHTNKGSITIDCRLDYMADDKVQLRFYVKDTGKGISKADLPHVFDAFFQGDDQLVHSINGMGLGLSICKELISRMNGRIWVESELGKGTTFYFTITLSMYSEQFNSSNMLWYGKYKEFYGMSVLLVEDNGINQELAKEILNNKGIIVDTADNGAEAIKALQSNKYDVVLMDIQMPVMDGLEATKHIRKGDVNSNIPIIAMTASVMEEDREVFLSGGINGIVEKPLRMDLLLQEIYKWTKGKNLFEESALTYDENLIVNKKGFVSRNSLDCNLCFFEELSELLKENNVDALDYIKVAEYKEFLMSYNTEIKSIENNIKQYDFQSALDKLKLLYERIYRESK